MRIYLDVSCLNRPFDDQSQPRVRLESEAVAIIFESLEAGKNDHLASQMALVEIAAISDPIRRNRVLRLLPEAIYKVTPEMLHLAKALADAGLGAADAVHVAAAKALNADVLLTVDDRLIRRCRALADRCPVRVENPIRWIEEIDRDTDT